MKSTSGQQNGGTCPACGRHLTRGVLVCPWCQAVVIDRLASGRPHWTERALGILSLIIPLLLVSLLIGTGIRIWRDRAVTTPEPPAIER
ncbi:MAG: hypothetical protein ACREMQ_10490 [Longimicrobiales bacterium]